MEDVMIIDLSFNAPASTFTSTNSLNGGFAVTPTLAGSTGHPAKNRGLNFDGSSDGFALISSLFLNHSFSVHSWILLAANDANMNLFSKDRNDDVGMNLVQCRVNSSGQIEGKIASDTSPFAFGNANGATTLNTYEWYYLVWSFEMIDGSDTSVELFVNNASDAASIAGGKFLMDGAGYNAYIGIERTSTTVYDGRWNGYIYDFYLYQLKHVVSYT
jgi:hypothetical protein